MNISRSLIPFLAILYSFNVYSQVSQTFSIRKYDNSKGLPGSAVYGISQDEDGYIWIGTDRELCRFDGVSFMIEGRAEEIKSKVIERVYCLSGDSILVIGAQPNNVYLITSDQCSRINFGIDVPIKGQFVSFSKEDQSLVYAYKDKIYHFKDNIGEIRFSVPRKSGSSITTVKNLGKDSFFVATKYSSFLIGKNGGTEIKELKGANSFFSTGDSSIVFVRNKIFVLRNNRIKLWTRFRTPNVVINKCLFDKKGYLWMTGRNRGLYVMQGGEIKDVTSSITTTGEQITQIFSDKTGNIWVGTASSGLICILQNEFTNYSTMDGLSSNSIKTICDWNGDIYIGTNAGLNRLNKKGIINGDTLAGFLKVCSTNRSSIAGYIYKVMGNKDRLMLSTNFHKGVASHCSSSDVVSFASSAFNWQNDTIILANWGRLLTKKIDSVNNKKHNIVKTKIDQGKEYFVIKDEVKGGWLVGSSAGLYQTEISLRSTRKINIPIQREKLIFRDGIFLQKNLWLATNAGLLHRDVNDNWTLYTMKKGLNSNQVTCLEADHINRLWIGTDRGINVLVRDKFINYNKGNRLVSGNISDLHYFETDSTLWVGANQGLACLKVGRLNPFDKRTYPLYITGINVLGDRFYAAEAHLELKPAQNNISVHFSALHYNNPDDVTYQYKLIPGDAEWRNCNSTQVNFFSLSPNKYSFFVRARVSGSWWGAKSQFDFTVKPQVWETWQFKAAIILFLFLSFWLVFKNKLNKERLRQQKRNQLLLKVNHLEQQTLSLSMNPHFIFNSLNSIQSFFSPHNNLKANNFIADIAHLIRLNMEASEKKYIGLSEEIDRLKLYLSLEKTRIDKPFEYEVITSEDLETEFIQIPNMLIQPLVENAIWHGIQPSLKDGFVKIKFEHKGYLEITVTDNGIGISKASGNRRQGHQPKGILISRERLKYLSERNSLHIEDILDKQKKVIGTKATLIIYLDEDGYL